MKIEHKGVAELARALARRADMAGPSGVEIVDAMELAYRAGRNDGAIAALDELGKKWALPADKVPT
jgi:hypothetical protein